MNFLFSLINFKLKQSNNFIITLFFILFSTSVMAIETNEALNLLNKMSKAVQTSDYQMHFVSQDREQFTITFEYNHLGAVKKENINAQLLYLEGPEKEIILHNDTTSYFQPDSPSFSIASSRISEAFPDVVYNDFNSLASIYDFILLGKTRTANRSVQLVKVIAKDRDRYSYVIWIEDRKSVV